MAQALETPGAVPSDPAETSFHSSAPVHNLETGASDEKFSRSSEARDSPKQSAGTDSTSNAVPPKSDDGARRSDDAEPKDEKQQAIEAVKESDGKAKSNDATNVGKYPTGTKLALLTLGLAFGTFLVALDNSIIATAIPRITTEFDALNDVGWYGSSYLLTTTSLQPSFGKVYAYFDVKWTYLSALLIFERMSSEHFLLKRAC